jgi:hypothetical protein
MRIRHLLPALMIGVGLLLPAAAPAQAKSYHYKPRKIKKVKHARRYKYKAHKVKHKAPKHHR